VPDLPEKTVARRRQLGDHLRTARQGLGLTQENTAHAAGLDRSFYGEVEIGKHSLTVDGLFAIPDALSVTVEELVRDIK